MTIWYKAIFAIACCGFAWSAWLLAVDLRRSYVHWMIERDWWLRR